MPGSLAKEWETVILKSGLLHTLQNEPKATKCGLFLDRSGIEYCASSYYNNNGKTLRLLFTPKDVADHVIFAMHIPACDRCPEDVLPPVLEVNPQYVNNTGMFQYGPMAIPVCEDRNCECGKMENVPNLLSKIYGEPWSAAYKAMIGLITVVSIIGVILIASVIHDSYRNKPQVLLKIVRGPLENSNRHANV